MCIVEDLVNATGAVLGHVDAAVRPEQALLMATTEVITAITEGRGVITCDRMLAMAEVVTANANLRKQASLTRKRARGDGMRGFEKGALRYPDGGWR